MIEEEEKEQLIPSLAGAGANGNGGGGANIKFCSS